MQKAYNTYTIFLIHSGRCNMLKQKLPDFKSIDIAKPIERKRFKITPDMIILCLIAIAQYMVLKIFIIDGILFNTSLELDLFQHNLAMFFADITKVPDVNVDFSQIDTTNLYTVIHQTLKYFVVDPIMTKAEAQIMQQLNSIFDSLAGQGKLLM